MKRWLVAVAAGVLVCMWVGYGLDSRAETCWKAKECVGWSAWEICATYTIFDEDDICVETDVGYTQECLDVEIERYAWDYINGQSEQDEGDTDCDGNTTEYRCKKGVLQLAYKCGGRVISKVDQGRQCGGC